MPYMLGNLKFSGSIYNVKKWITLDTKQQYVPAEPNEGYSRVNQRMRVGENHVADRRWVWKACYI
jgi:hypothetical protein